MSNRPAEPLLILALLLAPVFLPAQDDYNSFGDGIFNDGIFGDGTNFPELTGEPPEYTEDGKAQKTPQTPQTPQAPQEPETTEKKEFRVKNRMVELNFMNTSVDFSNNFVAVSDAIRDPVYLLGNINNISQDPGLIWKDPVVINLDNFFSGFNVNFGAAVKPFSINFNWKDNWGVGLDIAHVDITGNLSLSGNLVTFSETEKDKFGVGGAVFVDVGVPFFFYYDDFKVKLRPAVYAPVIYTEPKVTYRYAETAEGTHFEIDYDMQVYSLVSMEGTDGGMDVIMQGLADNAWGIARKNLGYDFGLSIEYPWRYDIDIGVDIVNIPVPFAMAKLNHYMHLNGTVWVNTGELSLADLVTEDEEGNTKSLDDLRGTVYDYPDKFTPEYKFNAGGKKIFRPFAMVFYAHYRPFETSVLTLIPSLGFSISRLYPKVGAVEGGLSARFDTANMFITTLGINYNDRRWRNSIDFILNLRAFEFDLGISFQSQNFVRSWQGAGLGINLGFKFGW